MFRPTEITARNNTLTLDDFKRLTVGRNANQGTLVVAKDGSNVTGLKCANHHIWRSNAPGLVTEASGLELKRQFSQVVENTVDEICESLCRATDDEDTQNQIREKIGLLKSKFTSAIDDQASRANMGSLPREVIKQFVLNIEQIKEKMSVENLLSLNDTALTALSTSGMSPSLAAALSTVADAASTVSDKVLVKCGVKFLRNLFPESNIVGKSTDCFALELEKLKKLSARTPKAMKISNVFKGQEVLKLTEVSKEINGKKWPYGELVVKKGFLDRLCKGDPEIIAGLKSLGCKESQIESAVLSLVETLKEKQLSGEELRTVEAARQIDTALERLRKSPVNTEKVVAALNKRVGNLITGFTSPESIYLNAVRRSLMQDLFLSGKKEDLSSADIDNAWKALRKVAEDYKFVAVVRYCCRIADEAEIKDALSRYEAELAMVPKDQVDSKKLQVANRLYARILNSNAKEVKKRLEKIDTGSAVLEVDCLKVSPGDLKQGVEEDRAVIGVAFVPESQGRDVDKLLNVTEKLIHAYVGDVTDSGRFEPKNGLGLDGAVDYVKNFVDEVLG